MNPRRALPILLLPAAFLPSGGAAAPPPKAQAFTHRGYYLTFMRMPTYGLREWKRTVDLFRQDGVNTLVLWTAGGFRSRRFPETWQHNRDHANIRRDFLRELIDHAHRRNIRVLLGFTPFGYDGVNRMALTRPEWRATGPDGKPVAPFGIHCWGYNLCPGREDTQRFMREYIGEMLDFYPNADGLLVESSDYAACHGPECGPRYYEHEFRFVKAISEELRRRKSTTDSPGGASESAIRDTQSAMVVVYPHYFSGATVPGLNVRAARLPFDSRWSLFFTPHSAHPEPDLIRQAPASFWSDDPPARRGPREIREGARRARQVGCSGYLPSFEAFTYVYQEPEEGQRYLVGRRQLPLGCGWLPPGKMPYDELPARLNRFAFREYTRNPDLPEPNFRAVLRRELFRHPVPDQAVEDALTLQRLLNEERTWSQAAPIASPERVRALRQAGQWTPERQARLRQNLEALRTIEARWRGRRGYGKLLRPVRRLLDQWPEAASGSQAGAPAGCLRRATASRPARSWLT